MHINFQTAAAMGIESPSDDVIDESSEIQMQMDQRRLSSIEEYVATTSEKVQKCIFLR